MKLIALFLALILVSMILERMAKMEGIRSEAPNGHPKVYPHKK